MDTILTKFFCFQPDEWNDVTYIYDGQEFIGIVNGVRRYVSRQDPHLLGIIGGEIKSVPTQGTLPHILRLRYVKHIINLYIFFYLLSRKISQYLLKVRLNIWYKTLRYILKMINLYDCFQISNLSLLARFY